MKRRILHRAVYAAVIMSAACFLTGCSNGAEESTAEVVTEAIEQQTAVETTTVETTERTTEEQHDTKNGKCLCGEYHLDDAFIPSADDFADCIGLETIPSYLTLSFSNTTDTGFDYYMSLSDEKRVEGCQDIGWDVALGYVGTEEIHILSTYSINYMPENESELNALYSAITAEMENRYGSPKNGGTTWKVSGVVIKAAKLGNAVSVNLELE